jgi:tetratricopeptide (TPR) repeat protein
MNNLANSYYQLSRFDDALKLWEQTLELRQARQGPDHPDTITAMHNLAVSYYSQGKHEKVCKLCEPMLEQMKNRLGADHPYTLSGMNVLAASLTELKRPAEALKIHEQVLVRRKAKLGPDHPDTLGSMYNIANLYVTLDRETEALKLFEITLERRKATLGPYHNDTLSSQWGIIDVLVKLKRHDQALNSIDTLLATAEKAFEKGQRPYPTLAPQMFSYRIKAHRETQDVAGCRTTAERWEKRNPRTGEDLFLAARFRSVSAALQVLHKGSASQALASQDAELAMKWLTQAVAAGFKDRDKLETHDDLTHLRDREDFKRLLERMPRK